MIHKSAIIDKSAKLDSNVNVGPFSIIGPEVEIESGTSIGSHVVIEGPTTIGKNNKFFSFSSNFFVTFFFHFTVVSWH